MENQKLFKIIVFLSVASLVFALIAIGTSLYVYKKTSQFFQPVSSVVSGVNQAGQQSGISSQNNEATQMATGFVGLPVGEIQTKDETKKFNLQGHWVFKEKPWLDYIGKDEKIKITIVVIPDTKIMKIIFPTAKDKKFSEEPISFNDFKSLSKINPYLVTFGALISSSNTEVNAHEIRIFPMEIK